MRSRILALVTTAAMLGTSACQAEFLYFSRGGQIQAPVRREGGRLWVEIPEGRFSFKEGLSLSVVSGGCPEREWGARRDFALGAGVEARFAAAWWALENGLIPESVSMLRSVSQIDPKHQPTARLIAILDRLDRPGIDPDTSSLVQALGVSCDVERGPHVLLLHQHDAAEARARVELLEKVALAFHLILTAQGIDLHVSNRRLVSVYLRDQQDYLAFLGSQNASAFKSTLGYYHPNHRAVVTFDPRFTGKSKAISRSTQGVTIESSDESNRRRALSALDVSARADGTAAHELIHLLTTETGFSPYAGGFPLWFHEGFAAQFEVIRGGRWAGVGRVHDLRLPDWRSQSTPPSLELLIRDSGFGQGYRRDLYARSWALVFFLRKTRAHEFTVFLDLLRLPETDRSLSNPDRFERAFHSAFGTNLRALESEWHAFMAQLQTPLEDNAPTGSPVSTLFPS